MATYIAIATTVDDMEAKRAPHRPAHLDYLRRLHSENKVVFAGAVLNPIDSSVLVYRASSLEEAQSLVDGDPYQSAGLWTAVKLREFVMPIGDPQS